MERILTPLKKINGNFSPISFNEAYQTIYQKIKSAKKEETAVFASGKLSNEELYLIQKLTRIGIKTNALGSFEYIKRPCAFCFDKNDIVPFAELYGATKCYCLGFDHSTSHPQLDIVSAAIRTHAIDTFFFSDKSQINDFEAFFKAVNYYIVTHERYRGIFVEGLAKNLEEYLYSLKEYKWSELLSQNLLNEEDIKLFVDELLEEKCPVFIFYEPNVSVSVIKELNNLALLIGIQAKGSSGLLGIKENINSQGLFDMGIFPHLNVGGDTFDTESIETSKKIYGLEPAHEEHELLEELSSEQFKNIIIFQENPLSENDYKVLIKRQLEKAFLIVQSDYVTETTALADIILPASQLKEEEGTYTDSTRMAFKIDKEIENHIEKSNYEQITELNEMFGLTKFNTVFDAFLEYVSFFKAGCRSSKRHYFKF